MTDLLSWIATVATIGGALLTASNLGARITGSGFVVFLFGSLCWLAVGLQTGQQALIWTNAVLTVLNIFGIWRWLGRQAAVEEGGKSAAEASELSPGEALFPVSLLTRAKVRGAGGAIGSAVDAMAGASSGRIVYVVVSEGGVAGIGERLFKLPWSAARMQGEELGGNGLDELKNLEELAKDEWPGR